MRGRPTTARATATRWRSPPDSWFGPVPEAVREPDLVERLLGARPALAERQAGVEQAVGDVVERRPAVEQEELLEHEPDRARPERRERAVGELGRRMPVDPDRPGRRPLERPEDVEERRLARAGRADDRDELALLDRERDAAQRGDVGPVALLEPGCLEDGASFRRPPRSTPSATPLPSISTYPSANDPGLDRRERSLPVASRPPRRRRRRRGAPGAPPRAPRARPSRARARARRRPARRPARRASRARRVGSRR